MTASPQPPVAAAPSNAALTPSQAELELKLRAAEAENTRLSQEVTTLSAKVEAREEQDRQAKVDGAYETWKDKKGLTEAQKPAMMVLLKASPESFDAMYPKVEAGNAHLLRSLTGAPRAPQGPEPRPRVPADKPEGNGAPGEGGEPIVMSLRQLSFQLMQKHKIPLAVAQRKAKAMLNAQRRAQSDQA